MYRYVHHYHGRDDKNCMLVKALSLGLIHETVVRKSHKIVKKARLAFVCLATFWSESVSISRGYPWGLVKNNSVM